MATDATPKPILIYLDKTGEITVNQAGANPVLYFRFVPQIFLGATTELEVSFKPLKANYSKPSDIQMNIAILDGINDFDIVRFKGIVSDDDETVNSIVFNAHAIEFFAYEGIDFEIQGSSSDVMQAIKASVAFNEVASFTSNKKLIALPDDPMPAFSATRLAKILKNLPNRPSDIALTGFGSEVMPIAVVQPLMESLYDIGVPITIEMDSKLSTTEAPALAKALALNSYEVTFFHAPLICRPYGSVSLIGKKVPFYGMGQYLAHKVKRNMQKDAKGIPPLATPISGEDFPFVATALQLRPDVIIDDDVQQAYAEARVNLLRPIDYSSGTSFVLSDVLTTYESKTENSALRLTSCAEVSLYATYRTNQILCDHLLRRKTDFLKKAQLALDKFYTDMSTAGLFQPAQDLDYRPYSFTLTPNPEKPYERMDYDYSHGLDGVTRSVNIKKRAVVK